MAKAKAKIERRITMIKFKEDSIVIKYEVDTPDGVDEVLFTSADPCKPEFDRAVESLSPHFVDWMSTVKIKTEPAILELHFKHYDKTRYSLSAKLEYDAGSCIETLKIKLPPRNNKLLPDQGADFNPFLLETGCKISVTKIFKCANAYIEGERLQASLPYED